MSLIHSIDYHFLNFATQFFLLGSNIRPGLEQEKMAGELSFHTTPEAEAVAEVEVAAAAVVVVLVQI